MITKNIDISDTQINEHLIAVKYIAVSQNEVKTIDLTMYDVFSGQTKMNGKDLIARPTSEFRSKEKKHKFI